MLDARAWAAGLIGALTGPLVLSVFVLGVMAIPLWLVAAGILLLAWRLTNSWRIPVAGAFLGAALATALVGVARGFNIGLILVVTLASLIAAGLSIGRRKVQSG